MHLTPFNNKTRQKARVLMLLLHWIIYQLSLYRQGSGSLNAWIIKQQIRCLVQGDLLVQKTVVINEHLDCVMNGYGKRHKQLSHDIEHIADVESVLRQVDELKNKQHRK